MTQQLPLVAITLGDPVGIGPEVVAKAIASGALSDIARLVVIGSAPVLDKALALTDSSLWARSVANPSDAVSDGEVAIYEPNGLPDGLADLPYGAVSADAGEAAIIWVKAAAELAMAGRIDAIATAPINKHAASLAGYTDVGHQEIYQSMTGVEQVVTMLVTPGLRVVHLTTHRSLRIACDYVTKDNVLAKLHLTHEFFTSQGFSPARIATAALNPHGGEAGIIGTEEIEEIAPAVKAAVAAGINVTGPIPADTVFNQAIDGKFDVVLAMYHDQGHVAIKVHDWASSATINLGLPFLRTSVDHGTAFDIAGQGIADSTGMIQAVRLAALVSGSGSIADF
ncbi:MAG: 4-hydroxythreonine-4-phosphate dehydrogenase PdxA [Chloroflexi bacterium]|nr:4-hydroxythreonine-4-phosphate dehydrogenase PdxA [Chloroflexota bacterium]MDA1173222.1 4-hydroxythreonine-4-phosphate dehydrogenase PdxA [Chloroflexota bacterium]